MNSHTDIVRIRGCVIHHSSAAVVEERIRATAERDAHRMQGCFTCTIGSDFEIQKITSVRTIRIVFTVFLHVRLEGPPAVVNAGPSHLPMV